MSTREKAVELLNAAKLAGNGNSKVDCLRGLMELVVRKESALLPEFLPEVLELQVDPSPAVKRFLADFVDAAVATSPSAVVLQHSLACLRGLLTDGVVATSKRALQSCYTTFKTAYTLVALQGSTSDRAAQEQLRAVWEEAHALKAAIAATAAGPGNDAVRMAAARFLEQTVLLLTAELVPIVAHVSTAAAPLAAGNVVTNKAALVRDAEAALVQLVALLKQGLAGGGGGGATSLVTITAIKAAAGIAQQRPQFLGRFCPPLLALANSIPGATEEQADVTAPANGAQANMTSALSSALLALARSTHPTSQPWKKKIGAALEALGVQPDRNDKRAQPSSDEPNKRIKLDAIPQQQSIPPQLEPDSQRSQPDGLPTAAAPVPVTPPEQLAKVLTVLQALVAKQDASMLAGVVGSLQPSVLADVVMAYMVHLPQPHTLPPDPAPLPPWVDALLQLVAGEAPLQQGDWNTQQQAANQPKAALPSATTSSGAPQQVQQQLGQQQPPQQPQQTAGPPHIKQVGPSQVKKAAGQALPTAASFRLEPVPLTEEQQRQLRLSAVFHILRTDKTSRQQLRSTLVAKLAAERDFAMGPAILQQLVKGIASDASNGGAISEVRAGSEFEVALLWLSALFAWECQPSMAAAGIGPALDMSQVEQDAAASAHQQQRQVGAAKGVAGLGSQSGTASPYGATLLQLLDGLKRELPPTSKFIARVLIEAPALPMPAVRDFLQQLVESGPDWCTLGLLATRDVILNRPPNRSDLLQLVLDACCSPISDTRSKAVRLVANRLFPDPGMAHQIEQAARQRLDAMLPSTTPAAAEELVAVKAEQPSPEETQATLPASPSAQAAAAQRKGESADAGSSEQQPSQTAQDGAQQVEQPQRIGEDGTEVQAAGPSDTDAAQLCALYCALCTKKHSLLRHLFEVYAQTSDGGRMAIQRNAVGLAKTLGASAPALLAVVQDPPAGSLPLVLQTLHVLTEAAIPPTLMVTACLQLYDSCKDARVLVPALRGVDCATALRLLPALLELQPEQLRPALQRLVAPLAAAVAAGSGGEQAAPIATAAAPPVVSPAELLSALHTLDHSHDSSLLRKMMQGMTVCISSPALFPPESLAACINQLLTRVPLPQLFMRTVIQTVAAAPRLRTFVVGILRQLALKQIWKDTTQWKGWLMCAQQTIPDSFPALVSLPADVLGTAAKAMPKGTKQQLLDFAKQGSVAVPSTTIAALEEIQTLDS